MFIHEEEIPIYQESIRKCNVKSITGYTKEIKNGIQAQDSFKSYVLKFDNKGNKMCEYKYSKEGKLIREKKYDCDGKIVKEINYEISSKINYEFKFLYDENGNRTEKSMYLSGSKFYYKFKAKYDSDRKIIEDVCYDASNQIIRNDTYVYDDRSKLIKLIMGHLGEWVFEYDESGNLRKKSGNLLSGSAYGENFEYQFDDKGLLRIMKHLHYSVTIFDYSFYRANLLKNIKGTELSN